MECDLGSVALEVTGEADWNVGVLRFGDLFTGTGVVDGELARLGQPVVFGFGVAY